MLEVEIINLIFCATVYTTIIYTGFLYNSNMMFFINYIYNAVIKFPIYYISDMHTLRGNLTTILEYCHIFTYDRGTYEGCP